jgi:hypothetical protein
MLALRWENELLDALNSPDHPGGVAIEPGSAPAESNILRLKPSGRRTNGRSAHDGPVIEEYPPTAYVTQLVVRALSGRHPLESETRRNVRRWAVAEINRQIALFASSDKTADAYALAYSTILLENLSSLDQSASDTDESTPEEASLARAAIKLLFDQQRKEDGTWPPSRPLFHYPGAGNAYCFEYEMLVQLLKAKSLRSILLDHLDEMGRAVRSLNNQAFVLKSHALAWASGHHPQSPGPESWSTASVYHFLYELDRLVAEAVRKSIFVYLDQLYKKPTEPKIAIEEFLPASEFLDSTLWIGNTSSRLKDALKSFVEPIAKGAKLYATAARFPVALKCQRFFLALLALQKQSWLEKLRIFLAGLI